MSIPGSANPLLLKSAAAATYSISRSLRFNSPDSAYLSRTPSVAGNRKTWTWAGWVKRSGLGSGHLFVGYVAGNDNQILEFRFSNNQLHVAVWTTQLRVTTQVFRDTSAWAHVVLAVDTTQAVANDRVKLYWNGAQITQFDTTNNPAQNADLGVNQAGLHTIGQEWTGTATLNGLLADVFFIDGQALPPSSFTEVSATTGQLIPKQYTGSFGTNGFWLKFSDNSAATATTLGKDYSGNNNHWTSNNISVTAGAGNDSLVDTPTSYGTDDSLGGSVRGNYATWNPLNIAGGALANGNLDLTNTGGGRKASTFAVSSGKWYWEVSVTSAGDAMIGTMPAANPVSTGSGNFVGGAANEYGYYQSANKYTNGTATSYGATFGNGDVIGVALDLDAGTLVYYKNGVSQGTAFTGITGTYTPAVSAGGSSGASMTANFGQRPFAYTAPSGFKALCDTNLPAPVVAKPSNFFDVIRYVGNGTSQTLSGLNFSPDFLWGKNRSNAFYNVLVDSIRGATARLFSNTTDAESVFANSFTAFTSNGFSVGSASDVNNNNDGIVVWAWDAGSSTVTNTAGTITGGAQVRANASAGVSIVTWQAPASGSGWTVGHGLGAAPFLMIDKCRSNVGAWSVYHQSLGATKYLALNLTDAAATSSAVWNDTAPTSQVFTCGTTGWYGASFTHVTYCFAPVAGFSAFGSYTGNGSADGPFVYTGMLARWILLKRTDTTGNWTIIDTARLGYNVDNNPLYPNLADAEATTDLADILSNGFKLRTTDASVNASGGTYVYASFASSPFAYSRSR